jgi:L-lactate dehydrogenase complex protein LldG
MITPNEFLLDRFTREAAALGVTVHRPSTREAAIAVTLDLLRAAGAGEFLAWDASELPLPGVLDAARAAGLQPCRVALPADAAGRAAALAELEHVPAGLTGALGALADTGSLALVSGPGRPRLASLLPPVHVALLAASALYPTMAAFFAAQPAAVRAGANLVFVSGPSRTADIELTLTLGVHGPKTVQVVVAPG